MEEFVAINELNAVNKSNQGKSNNIEMYNSQGSLHCKRHPSEHAVSKSKTSYSGEDGIPTEVGDECDLSALLEDMGIFISRHFGSITAEQRERAINVARLLKPKNPAFMVILRSRSIKKSCLMYVPAKFANKHLSRDTKFVKLQDSIGKEWPVQIAWRQKDGLDLTKEKNLEKGDMCVFELIRKNDILLKVSVCHPTVL